jgi:ATP-dependent RNA helicase DHX29
MTSISTPDAKQSEAYIATVALFLIFGSSTREDKVSLRLPATWRDLWAELAEEKKEKADTIDRDSIRKIRDMVREKKDQELEDGVLLKGAFKGRGPARVVENGDDQSGEKGARSTLTPDAYQRIWFEKSNTQSFQYMLVSHTSSSSEILRLTTCSNPGCSFLCGDSKIKFSRPLINSKWSLYAERQAGNYQSIPSIRHS